MALTTGVCGSLESTEKTIAEMRVGRFFGTASTPNPSDRRTDPEKDRGRVAYSPFLRRLSGVTQVVSPSSHASVRHTRESHSQKVSLLCRELAEDLVRRSASDPQARSVIEDAGGLCIPACETAGLAHDLGHPPFGHAGEVELNQQLRRCGVPDGFEGNAQTFRILTRLARRKPATGSLGLDLTAVTLAAVSKYPYVCASEYLVNASNAEKALDKPPKFGVYREDTESFLFAARSLGLLTNEAEPKAARSLEAAIMDVADDLAYAIHDLEDFYREDAIDFAVVWEDLDSAANLLLASPLADIGNHSNPFIQVAHELAKDFGGFFNQELYARHVGGTKNLIDRASLKSRCDSAPVKLAHVSSALSLVLGDLCAGVEISATPPWPEGPRVYLRQNEWHQLQPLKTITRRYVVGSRAMSQLERTQRTVIGGLFAALVEWLEQSPSLNSLPQPLAAFLIEAPEATAEGQIRSPLVEGAYRAVADYICTFSDEEATDRFRWFSGMEMPALRERL